MQYFRPGALDDALDILSRKGVRIAAGCTDLFPATSAPALAGTVLDITAVEGLRDISRQQGWWRIGGAATWSDILRADLPGAFDALKLAAREVGSVQIQNAGTIAGNLCNASPAADGVPALLTLDASVELTSKSGRRVLPLGAFITGARQTVCQPCELMTAILVPDAKASGCSTFLKLGARKYLVISIAMVAVRLAVTSGTIDEAAIAVGACSPVAARLAALEDRLRGRKLAAVTDFPDELVRAHLSPIDDVRGGTAYRLSVATTLVRRALVALANGAASKAA